MATRRDPAQVPYIALRAKVTRAKKRGNPDELLKVAHEVTDYFNAHFWPDNWASWRNDLADPLPWGSTERYLIENMF